MDTMIDDVKNNFVTKNTWTQSEDTQLKNLVEAWEKKHGTDKHSWNDISKNILGRSGEQCRKRWRYKLDPKLKRDVAWTIDEDNLLRELQAKVGNKWAMIGKLLKGRSDVDVKNRFFSTQRKRKIEEDEEEIRRGLNLNIPIEYPPQQLTHNTYPYQDHEHSYISSCFTPDQNVKYANMSYPQQEMNFYYNYTNNFQPTGVTIANAPELPITMVENPHYNTQQQHSSQFYY